MVKREEERGHEGIMGTKTQAEVERAPRRLSYGYAPGNGPLQVRQLQKDAFE